MSKARYTNVSIIKSAGLLRWLRNHIKDPARCSISRAHVTVLVTWQCVMLSLKNFCCLKWRWQVRRWREEMAKPSDHRTLPMMATALYESATRQGFCQPNNSTLTYIKRQNADYQEETMIAPQNFLDPTSRRVVALSLSQQQWHKSTTEPHHQLSHSSPMTYRCLPRRPRLGGSNCYGKSRSKKRSFCGNKCHALAYCLGRPTYLELSQIVNQHDKCCVGLRWHYHENEPRSGEYQMCKDRVRDFSVRSWPEVGICGSYIDISVSKSASDDRKDCFGSWVAQSPCESESPCDCSLSQTISWALRCRRLLRSFKVSHHCAS